MKQSQLFNKTIKIIPKEAETISHQFLLKGDFIEQLSSGIYSFLPLGWRVHKKIEEIIREEILKTGAQELFLPTLQPKSIWLETKRWEDIDPPLFKLRDRHQKEFALGPTHEEVITALIRKRIRSYKELPLALFQIQNKFRNEMRPTGGLLRVREFLMKDLYSFHPSKENFLKFYQLVKNSYLRIFKRCKLKTIYVKADPGTIGGEFSHEFVVLSKSGEDKVLFCPKCGFGEKLDGSRDRKFCPKCKEILIKENCIELAHLFYLGKKYSQPMGANFIDKDGKLKPILMGCYGIGLGRLLATVVEVWHDEKGIIWPPEISPFQVHLIQIEKQSDVKKSAKKIYHDLLKSHFEVLYDDRDEKGPGEKLADCDLIGIPWRIVISKRTLKNGKVEIKKREEKTIKFIKINRVLEFLRKKWPKKSF